MPAHVDPCEMTNPRLTLLALCTLLVAVPAEAQISSFSRRSPRPAIRTTQLISAAPIRRAPVGQPRLTPSAGITPSVPLLPPPQPGLVQCTVTAAGVLAPATIEVRYEGRVMASGACGERIEVPGGDYYATITLERAIDRPQQTVPLHVPENGIGTATAAFDTSILEVRFMKDGVSTFGQAILERDGRELGSIGSGVVTFVSSGPITIRARHLSEWKTYTVDLAPGQRRAIYAIF